MGVTQKHLSEGSSFPDSDPNLMRVYSMRFCPFAQRTRLALRYLNIPHEEVNINLKSKPDWFLQRNPLGLVPVLELGDKIVYESAICNEYLNETHGNKLLPSDPYEKARVRILMDGYGKVIEKFYGVMRLKTEEERQAAAEELRKHLQKYEDALKSEKYFGGAEPGLLDFHIWPWVERFSLLEKIGKVAVFPPEKFPKLSAWIKTMKDLPAVQQTIHSDELHYKFAKSFLDGGVPDYDIEL